ncbi:hypothetical protein M758_9G177500 [Ceratodon purpureus]|nr:hypothetical protein M758_9G177500 [Ceratodon purpureus]
MVRWRDFLFWFSLWTWKAFVVRMFTKPPDSRDEGDSVTGVALSSDEQGDVDQETQTSIDPERSSLAKILDWILQEKSMDLLFEKDDRVSSRFGYGITSEKTFGDRDSFNEIMGAIAASTTLERIGIRFNSSEVITCYTKGLTEALSSNRSVKKIVFNNGAPNREEIGLVSTVLLNNEFLEDVSLVSFVMDNEGASLLRNALHHNRTLKRLSLYPNQNTLDEEGWKMLLEPLSGGDGCNNVLEDFTFTLQGPECRNGNVHIGNMVRNNTSLRKVWITLGGKDHEAHTNVLSSIGEALCFNTRLSQLILYLDGFIEEMDILGGLFTSLVPDAQGQQSNTTLKCLQLHSIFGRPLKCDSLFSMLRSNTSLIELRCYGMITKAEVVVRLLDSLKGNKCLEILNLWGCEGVRGERVLGTIMDLLLENHHLKQIDLSGTPLKEDGSAQIVKAELEKRAKNDLWKVVEGMATTTPTSGRVFLCGEPYAGKTTLVKTIMEIHSLSLLKKEKRRKKGLNITKGLFKRSEKTTSDERMAEERTRGIEVHQLSCDGIDMTIWDMAGQEEYHAFHDLVVPNLSGNGSCSSFILVCDPQTDHKLRQPRDEADVERELLYWLRFIASNTRISELYKPHVTIVFTHFDKWCGDDRLCRRILEKVGGLKQKFKGLLEFEEKVYMINATLKDPMIATFKDSVDDVFKAMVDHLKGLLSRVPKTIEACSQLQQVVAKWIQANPNQLFLSWDAFSEICSQVKDLDVHDDSKPGLADMRKRFAALSLHDAGHLMYYEDFNIVVMNPHLLCHDIMGELITKCVMDKSNSELIINGCIKKDDLQSLLSKFPTAQRHQVSLHDVVQIMLRLKLCFEQSNEVVIIPATLRDPGSLDWPFETKAGVDYKYIGRRLACEDTSRTLLSPGFFPRLQVYLHEKLVDAYKIKKNWIEFIHDGVEVIIEYSDSNGFFIDIMIRSTKNEDDALDILHDDIVNSILKLCANPTFGCPGVKLLEFIMRPSCIENLISCKARRNQVVSVEKLKQMVLACGNLELQHTWPDEKPLKSGCDKATTLLGKKVSDHLFIQLRGELKKMEDLFQRNDHEKKDTNDCGSSLIEVEDTKPFIVTNEVLFNRMERMEVGIHERFDILERKIDEIKSIQGRLLPKICTNLDAMVRFTLEFQQHKYPRLPFLTSGEKQSLRRCIVTQMVPGMTSYVVQLLCEHRDGFHIVHDQEGCEVSFGTESTRKFLSAVRWGLFTFTVLAKVGAQVGGGMGSMIPNLAQGCLVLGNIPGTLGVDSLTIPSLLDRPVTSISDYEAEVAQEWLIETLKAKCQGIGDIQKTFQLQKVKYKDNGSVAWICNKHEREGRVHNNLDLLPSEIL